MLKTARTRSMRVVAAALMALATILVGFAHRPLEFAPRGYGADVASWILPDGTLPDLCQFAADAGHLVGDRPAGASQTRCEACMLSDAPGLGAVAGAVPAVPRWSVLARLDLWAPALRGSLLPAPQSRGPPAMG